MKRVMLIVIAVVAYVCQARTNTEIIRNLADVLSDCDQQPPEGYARPVVSVFCAEEMQEMGVDNAGFLNEVRAYVTNVACSASFADDEREMTRMGTMLNFLKEYDGDGSVQTFAHIITNSTVPSVVRDASFAYACSTRLALPAAGLYRSDAIKNLPIDRRSMAYRGMFSSMWGIGGDDNVTNRVISIALEIVNDGWGMYVRMDEELCRLWPIYSISSNRYMAVNGALSQPNMPTNTLRYLNGVMQTLTAQPSGRMHLLPTNQFNAAWNE